MRASVTERRRVGDEGLRVVKPCYLLRMSGGEQLSRLTSAEEEAPAKYVPAAAVIRMVRTLFGITGHKELVGGLVSLSVKSLGSTEELQWILPNWSAEGESGIPGGAVKCVDIRRNAGGESDSLVCN